MKKKVSVYDRDRSTPPQCPHVHCCLVKPFWRIRSDPGDVPRQRSSRDPHQISHAVNDHE